MSRITRPHTLAALIIAAALPTAALANPIDAGEGESAAMAAHFEQQSQAVSLSDNTLSGPLAETSVTAQVGQGQSAAMTETYRQNTQPLNLGRESVADMEGHYQSAAERAIQFSGHGESAAMARTYRNISEPLKVSDHTVAYQDLYQQDVLHGTHA